MLIIWSSCKKNLRKKEENHQSPQPLSLAPRPFPARRDVGVRGKSRETSARTKVEEFPTGAQAAMATGKAPGRRARRRNRPPREALEVRTPQSLGGHLYWRLSGIGWLQTSRAATDTRWPPWASIGQELISMAKVAFPSWIQGAVWRVWLKWCFLYESCFFLLMFSHVLACRLQIYTPQKQRYKGLSTTAKCANMWKLTGDKSKTSSFEIKNKTKTKLCTVF